MIEREDLVKAVFLSNVSLALQVSSGLLVFPIGLSAFGAYDYGVYLALSSFVSILTTGQAGLPLAATNLLVSSPRDWARSLVATLLAALTAISLTLLLVMAALLFHRDAVLQAAFGPTAGDEVFYTALAVIVGFLVFLPFSAAPACFAGVGRVVAQQVFGIGRALLRLVAILGVAAFDGTVVHLALIVAIGDLAIGLVGQGALLRTLSSGAGTPVSTSVAGEQEHPRKMALLRQLMRQGGWFAVLQVQLAVILNSDSLIISALTGPALVASYALIFRLYQLGGALLAGIQAPLMPWYRERLQANQPQAVGDMLALVIRLGLVVTTCGWVLASTWLRPLVDVALPQLAVSGGVIFWLGAYTVAYAWTSAHAVLLNAQGVLRSQAAPLGVEMVLNVGLSVALLSSYSIAGVAAATFTAHVLATAGPYPRLVRTRVLDGAASQPSRWLFAGVLIGGALDSALMATTESLALRLANTGLVLAATCAVTFSLRSRLKARVARADSVCPST